MITFFTVCGGGEEYEFLLGSIEHHAAIGNHLVLDTSRNARTFDHLFEKCPSVSWVYEPEKFQSGNWKTFKLASALEEARKLALERFPNTDFLVHLDCDEYYDFGVKALLQRNECPPIETPRTFTFHTIHWKDGRALRFGPSEWHLRAWDVRTKVRVIQNLSWQVSPKYNGNPEHHPIFSPAEQNVDAVRVNSPMHYHLHYALGKKRHFTETAEATIDGWPDGTPVENPCPWPDPLQKWIEVGELPSSRFCT